MNSTAFEMTPTLVILTVVLALWSIVWKGLALWRAGRRNQPAWFVVLLIVNTAGILELLYLFLVSKRSAASTTSDT